MSGTKVTTDPLGQQNPIQEGPGIITSDSLAAESLEQGGSFADGHAAASGQPSKGSTASNTDTSGATTLPPARNVEARGDAGFGDPAFAETLRKTGGDSSGAGFSAPGFADQLRKSGGDSQGAGFSAPEFAESLKKSGGDNSGAGFGSSEFADSLRKSGGDSQGAGFSAPEFADSLRKSGGDSSGAGFGSSEFANTLKSSGGDGQGAGFGAPGFADALKNSGGDNTGAGFSAPGFADTLKNSGGDQSGAGFSAPGFAQSLQGQQGGTAPSYVNAGALRGDQKPKGEGLKEGGIDDSAPNASFDSEIGSKNDPGRLAEEKFARSDAAAAADVAGSGARQSALSGDNQYSTLDAERMA